MTAQRVKSDGQRSGEVLEASCWTTSDAVATKTVSLIAATKELGSRMTAIIMKMQE